MTPSPDNPEIAAALIRLRRAQQKLLTAAARFGPPGAQALRLVGGPLANPHDGLAALATTETDAVIVRDNLPIAALRRVRGAWRIDPRPANENAQRVLDATNALAAAAESTAADAHQFPDAASLAATWALRRSHAVESSPKAPPPADPAP
jgi:hypothetical protein